MKRPRTPLLAAWLSLATCSSPGFAWDSRCYDYADSSLEPAAYLASSQHAACSPSDGPHTVRARWIGPLDEHRALFERARRAAGLPDSLGATVHLRVFTDGHTVRDGRASVPTYAPAPFEQTRAVAARAFTLAELAELPDFSYALWDWATGNEQCPLDGVSTDPIDCHAFSTYMGPVNSNHFLPQARVFYSYQHALALARASECRALAEQLGPDGRASGVFAAYPLACETEALAIEAVAQHYLQDAWSIGHMWQRWGAADLASVPGRTVEERRARALLAAMAAGLIHGARGILQAVPVEAGLDVNDALNAPNEAVRFVLDGVAVRGVGDDYLDVMVSPGSDAPAAAYRPQYDRLMACATAGLLAVYQRAGMLHGSVNVDATVAASRIDPDSDACWQQRATNAAMLAGTGVQYRVLGLQNELPLDARLVSWALPSVGTTAGHAEINPLLRNVFRLDLTRIASRIRLFARASPNGIELADGATGDLVGLRPNGFYLAAARNTSYVDPPLPWSGAEASTAPTAAVDRALALARTFRLAHASEWCAGTSTEAIELLRARIRSPHTPLSARDAACEACASIAQERLRVGGRAPLCTRLVATAPVFEAPPDVHDGTVAALSFCGCR